MKYSISKYRIERERNETNKQNSHPKIYFERLRSEIHFENFKFQIPSHKRAENNRLNINSSGNYSEQLCPPSLPFQEIPKTANDLNCNPEHRMEICSLKRGERVVEQQRELGQLQWKYLGSRDSCLLVSLCKTVCGQPRKRRKLGKAPFENKIRPKRTNPSKSFSEIRLREFPRPLLFSLDTLARFVFFRVIVLIRFKSIRTYYHYWTKICDRMESW